MRIEVNTVYGADGSKAVAIFGVRDAGPNRRVLIAHSIYTPDERLESHPHGNGSREEIAWFLNGARCPVCAAWDKYGEA